MAAGSRKTYPVETLREKVNRALVVLPDEMGEGRMALASLLEAVLMETGNYKGYRYLDETVDGNTSESFPYMLDRGDESRREYL